MCFHSKQSQDAQKLEHRFKAIFNDKKKYTPQIHCNGFDFPLSPIITHSHRDSIELGQWGLVPSWADKTWNKSYTLNARIETINQKPAFKDASMNRCILLVDGFYEWKQIGNKKIKYEIGIGGESFALGAIYVANESIKTFAIVTMEAQGVMREIHNTKQRMPLAIISDDLMAQWLDGDRIAPFLDFETRETDPAPKGLFDGTFWEK